MKYTKNQVLYIVDRCFKKWCSDYRNEAEETALEELGEFIVEPPTLRPMSELPEVFYEVVLVIEERKERYNMIVRKHEGYLVGENNIVFNSAKNFQSKDTNVSVIGWLHGLPNPNKIKLPC
jgi:hypothetical protein